MNSSESDEEKIDILLVDDREENLLTLESVLASPSYHLIKLTSGSEALRYLLDHEPALILMDVQMPALDGYETASIIKKNIRTRDIPIIFVTAINQDEQRIRQGYDRGAVDYVYKPYDPYILKAKVAVFAELARKTKRLLEYEKKIRNTERRDREQQIIRLELKNLRRHQSEQKKYLDLVEGISHGIVWSADAESLAISFISPSAENILGYSLDNWSLEEPFLIRYMHPDDRLKMMEMVHIVKTQKIKCELEHRWLNQKGQYVWFQTGLRIGQKPGSSEFEIRGLSVEISKIKEAEEILRLNKKHSDFLATASLLLSESLDFKSMLPRIAKLAVPAIADWCIIHLKNDADQFFPFIATHSEEDQIPKMMTLLSEYQPASIEAPLLSAPFNQNSLLQGVHSKAHLNLLNSFQLKSSIAIPLSFRGKIFGLITLLTTESSSAFHSKDFAMVQDLARRIMMAYTNAQFYQQAQSAIHVRDEFLSVASHELKTPLTPLKLQIQMLMRMWNAKNSELKPEKIDKLLQTSNRQLEKLALLIDKLLDIARMNSGKLQMNLEDFDLIEMIQDILDRFEGVLDHSKCKLVLDVPKNLKVHWDRFRMEQAFINLLTNAIKYGEGKPISIVVRLDHPQVKIIIKDQGIGIAKKDQERIFGRFERAVSANHFAGLGLGLYIVTQLMEAHQGTVTLNSEVGKGSTFTLSLPVIAKNLSVTPAELSAANEADTQWKGPLGEVAASIA